MGVSEIAETSPFPGKLLPFQGKAAKSSFASIIAE
jgi:hypothetical protein